MHAKVFISLNSSYVMLSRYARYSTFKSLIKEVAEKLLMCCKNLKLMLIYTVYEYKNGSITVLTSTRMTPT